MYIYQGDGADHLYGIQPRDYSDDELAALGPDFVKVVKASKLYKHVEDPKPPKAPKGDDGKAQGDKP